MRLNKCDTALKVHLQSERSRIHAGCPGWMHWSGPKDLLATVRIVEEPPAPVEQGKRSKRRHTHTHAHQSLKAMTLPCLLFKHRTRSLKKTPSTTFNALECRANHWTLVSVVSHACKTCKKPWLAEQSCVTLLETLYSKTWENTLVQTPLDDTLVKHSWMTLAGHSLWNSFAKQSCETNSRDTLMKHFGVTRASHVKLSFPFVSFFLLPFSFPTLFLPSLSLLLLYSVCLFSFHSFWPTGKRGSQIFQRRENGDLFSGVPGQEGLTKYSGTFFHQIELKTWKHRSRFQHKLTSTAPVLHWLCSLTFSSGPLVYDEPN